MVYAKRAGIKRSPDEFIEIANTIHKNFYDYSKTDYINASTKVIITCPIHGDFLIKPTNHLTREQGCKYCKTSCRSSEEHKIDLLLFAETYGHEVVSCPEDLNTYSTVKLLCNCGEGYLESRLHKILKENKKGCRLCSFKGHTKKDGEWIDHFKDRWCDRYDYTSFTSTGANSPCLVSCKLHGNFTTTPSKHKLRSGCPTCANRDSKFDNRTIAERHKDEYERQPCCLYLLKLNDDLYKFGISKELDNRVRKLLKVHGDVEILDTIPTNRYNAIVLEQFFLNLVKVNILVGRDFSEVFTSKKEDLLLLISLMSCLKS